jgi:hypothetical protein
VIPTCAVLTLEAVRARKPHWIVDDACGGQHEHGGDER